MVLLSTSFIKASCAACSALLEMQGKEVSRTELSEITQDVAVLGPRYFPDGGVDVVRAHAGGFKSSRDIPVEEHFTWPDTVTLQVSP
jgi:hypothetical protein